MEIEDLYGVEIVRGTTLTPLEYNEIQLKDLRRTFEDGSKELEISLSVLDRDLNTSLESLNTLSSILASKENISIESYPFIINTLKQIHKTTLFPEEFTSYSQEFFFDSIIKGETKEESYVREDKPKYKYLNSKREVDVLSYTLGKINQMGSKLVEVILEALSFFFDSIKALIRELIDYYKSKDKLSRKIDSKIRYLLNHSPLTSFTLKLSSKEASYFIIKEDVDLLETMAIYITTLESIINNKDNIANLDRLYRGLLSKDRESVLENELLHLSFNPPFPVEERVKDRGGCYKYLGYHLPKGYRLHALLPLKEDYQRSSQEERIHLLNNADTSLLKVNYTYPDKEYLIELDKEMLSTLNSYQLSFNQTCNLSSLYLRRLLSLLDKIKRAYHQFQKTLQKEALENNYTITYLNQTLAIVTFLARETREPLLSLVKLSQVTNDILLSALTELIETQETETQQGE